MSASLPRWAWIAALATSFVLGAVWHLPLPLALRLAGAGSLTEHAAFEGSITRWQAHSADGVEVRFAADALTLLTIHYGGQLEVQRGATRLTGAVRRDWDGAIALDDGTLDAGLEPLAAALGMPPSMLQGRLRVSGLAAVWRGGALVELACSGAVTGVRGGSGVDTLELGDLAIECTTGDAGPVATIADRGGPLAFAAELRFAPDGRFLLAGTAGARAGAPPELVQVLPLLGRSSGPDQVSFKFAGALPNAALRSD